MLKTSTVKLLKNCFTLWVDKNYLLISAKSDPQVEFKVYCKILSFFGCENDWQMSSQRLTFRFPVGPTSLAHVLVARTCTLTIGETQI